LQTYLKVNKDQLQTIINQHILEHSVNQVFEIKAASLAVHLLLETKANSYRIVVKSGIRQGLSLAIT
jgi:hypothetical protein